MKPAFAVIGANYGDEGKGLAVDFLTRRHTTSWDNVPIVARGNGGAQAGHTVETRDGKRHVFGHVGAGAFAGADTYLARNFILNPYVFEEELQKMGVNVPSISSSISAHSGCRVTTIFDMAMNSLREIARGNNRHGSCGLGINETVTRCLTDHELTLVDVRTSSQYMLAQRLKRMVEGYWKPQLRKLSEEVGYDIMSSKEAEPYVKIFADTDYEHHAGKMMPLRQIRMAHPYDPPGNERSLVYEGAQGLALDEHLGSFPHVTRSITGLPSALLAAHELGYKKVYPLYVTRAYLTRHGAGKLHSEGHAVSEVNIPTDKTNVTGQWQGHFRHAPLSLAQLQMFIQMDLNRSKEIAQLLNIEIAPANLMVTCMDHLGEKVATRRYGGKVEWSYTEDLPKLIEEQTNVKVRFLSYGPTAQDVQVISNTMTSFATIVR